MYKSNGKYSFAIDRGGTFTDVLCICPDNKIITSKLLSEDPANYADAPTEGIKRILLNEVPDTAINPRGLINTNLINWIRMGTTVATNALLERTGHPVVLVVNEGFKDLLQIGNQARPKIFDLNIRKPSNLYSEIIEVDCRIVPAQVEICELNTNWKKIFGNSGAVYLEKAAVNAKLIEKQLRAVLEKGIKSISVVLAHSYTCPDHEIQIGRIAKKLGFKYITLSHQTPMCRLVPRGFTACAEGYLTPHVEKYLDGYEYLILSISFI